MALPNGGQGTPARAGQCAEPARDARRRRAAQLSGTDEALWRDIAGRLTDWQGLLERQPVQARQILRKLLHGRLVFTPLADLGGYEIQGEASYGKLLAGLVPVGGTPELFENGWCPRGDSNTRHAV
jgi:hypothetical protein